MGQERKMEPEHLVGGALVLLLFSWFIGQALVTGHIRMGTGGHVIVNLSKQEQAVSYWFSVGWLGFFTIMGWIAIGLNTWRLWKVRRG